MSASLVLLTGASGSGKTTIARAVQQTRPFCEVQFFDSIGVPSAEKMAAWGTGHQPGGAWQRAMTLQWMEKIAQVLRPGRPFLFEGQMRIAFIQEALGAQNIVGARILLFDCEEQVRRARLVHDRRQPELADANVSWARYLRQEALAAGCEIIDTGAASVSELATKIAGYLD